MYFVVALLIGISSADVYKPAYKLPICVPKCTNLTYIGCAWKDNSTAECAECILGDTTNNCAGGQKCMFNTEGEAECKNPNVCSNCKNTSVVCIPKSTESGAECPAYVAPPATKAPASNGKKLATGPIECSLLLSAFMMMMSIFRVQQWKTMWKEGRHDLRTFWIWETSS